jgi:O-antigen ligase
VTRAILRALDDERSRAGQLAIVGALFAFAYFIVIGDAGLRDPPLALRILNGLAAGTVILVYLVAAPTRADRVDKAVVLALLLFAAAGVVALFPRQAFDGVLTALLFAGAFCVARSLLRSDVARRWFAVCLMVLSALITLLTAANWIGTFLEWWSLTDWTVFPPLNMDVFGGPWGHRHDLTLLVVMLYPAWFLLPMTALRMAIATVMGLLTGLIVIIDGSRTIWLAVALATGALALVAGRRLWPAEHRRRLVVGGIAVTVLAVFTLSGALAFLVERALSSESFDLRLRMWAALVDAWVESPVAGYGPGSFPWTLQLTDYFDTNTLAPRHPDNAAFQLLGEGGVLGLVGVGLLIAVLGPAVLRGRSRAALWALLVFLLASLGQNPTDFGYLVILAVGWAAYAVPHAPTAADPEPLQRSWPRWVTVGLFALVAAAWTSTAIGAVVYGTAREAIGREDWGSSGSLLSSAAALDPGMDLYVRQMAAANLIDGDPRAVSNAMEPPRSTPSDDLAWRVLTLALDDAADRHGALSALDSALDTQRSDPTNLLLLARFQLAADYPAARQTLAEIVQAWPEIVNAHGWSELLPPGVSTGDVLRDALDRWASGMPSPDPLGEQPVLLAAMAGDLDLASDLAEELIGPTLAPAAVAVLACQPDAAALLERATDQDRRRSLYWMLVERQAALEGDPDERAARLLEIMTGRPQAEDWVDHALNPLNENGRGYSADLWGYRRTPVGWPPHLLLPDPEAGAARLRVEPREAVRSAGLDVEMASCVGAGP